MLRACSVCRSRVRDFGQRGGATTRDCRTTTTSVKCCGGRGVCRNISSWSRKLSSQPRELCHTDTSPHQRLHNAPLSPVLSPPATILVANFLRRPNSALSAAMTTTHAKMPGLAKRKHAEEAPAAGAKKVRSDETTPRRAPPSAPKSSDGEDVEEETASDEPRKTFTDLGVREELVDATKALGYKNPTPVGTSTHHVREDIRLLRTD
jgi:hypothetical protein